MHDQLRVLDPTIAADRAEWDRLWGESAAQVPFAHHEVAGALERGRGRLLGLAYEDEGAGVLYPVVLREAGEGLRDLTSPYGYGGALVIGAAHHGLTDRFWRLFEDWARDERVVSEFVRLSLFPETLPHPGRIRRRNLNYVREMPRDRDAVWSGSSSKVRQNARRALRAGLTTRIIEDDTALADFQRIYIGTMERLDSAAWYRFDANFFRALHRADGVRVVYVAAEQDGRPVSMDLLLVGRDTAYYFLGGTDLDHASSRPNDLVKMAVMEWLAEQGVKRYVLGGGVRSGDGLERYKKGFAPDGEVWFCTAERILDPAGYETLLEKRRAEALDAGLSSDVDPEFFPAYRAPLGEPTSVPAGRTPVMSGGRA